MLCCCRLRYCCQVGGKEGWCGVTKVPNHPGRENVDLNVQPKKKAALRKPKSICESGKNHLLDIHVYHIPVPLVDWIA